MFGVLLTLMLIDGLLLGAVILMQAGQGGGLASLGGGTASQVLGGRQATTILTRMTWWCGGIFMALALVLSLTNAARGTGASAVQKQLQQQSRQGTQQDLPAAPLPGATTAPPAAAPTTPPPAPTGAKKP
jgi:preprotein translocase subunit SecG